MLRISLLKNIIILYKWFLINFQIYLWKKKKIKLDNSVDGSQINWKISNNFKESGHKMENLQTFIEKFAGNSMKNLLLIIYIVLVEWLKKILDILIRNIYIDSWRELLIQVNFFTLKVRKKVKKMITIHNEINLIININNNNDHN